jgi:hypothetical protein
MAACPYLRSAPLISASIGGRHGTGPSKWPGPRSWPLAANLLACFRYLALLAGELRDAAPKLLRYRLFHLPARITRGQSKRWLHLRADWPWTQDLIDAGQAVKALPEPA